MAFEQFRYTPDISGPIPLEIDPIVEAVSAADVLAMLIKHTDRDRAQNLRRVLPQ